MKCDVEDFKFAEELKMKIYLMFVFSVFIILSMKQLKWIS